MIVEGDVGGGLSRDALDHQPVRLAIDAIAEEGAIVGAAEVARVRSRLGHRAGEPRLRIGDGRERGEQDEESRVRRPSGHQPAQPFAYAIAWDAWISETAPQSPRTRSLRPIVYRPVSARWSIIRSFGACTSGYRITAFTTAGS